MISDLIHLYIWNIKYCIQRQGICRKIFKKLYKEDNQTIKLCENSMIPNLFKSMVCFISKYISLTNLSFGMFSKYLIVGLEGLASPCHNFTFSLLRKVIIQSYVISILKLTFPLIFFGGGGGRRHSIFLFGAVSRLAMKTWGGYLNLGESTDGDFFLIPLFSTSTPVL